jgi:hypothetical protein
MGNAKLDYVMKKHIRYLVMIEKRPFCYRDFLDFEVDDKRYGMTHGTFRNLSSNITDLEIAKITTYQIYAADD